MRPIRVCLVMHSTRSDNLGVGALTRSEVEILRDAARDLGRALEVTILDWKDARAPYVTGPDVRVVDVDTRLLVNPLGFLRIARGSDLVVDIGAGDSFADIYGPGRLRRLFLMKFLTHLARTPLVVAPQTIGPFTNDRSRRLARATLNRSAVVATRDALSTAAVRELGVGREVIEASDVALRLPYDPPPPRAPGGPLRVGLNVSGLLMGGGYTGKNEFGVRLDYPQLMRDLIGHFQAEGAEVHLVPHVIVRSGPMRGEDDARVSVALAAEFPGAVVAPSFASPSEAKTYIAGLDFFAGARMHACIAAFSAGVPVVPMAYSRKFAGLFGSLGYDRTVDCTASDSATVLAAVAQGFADRAVLAAEAAEALQRGLEKLGAYERGLRDLMAGLARRRWWERAAGSPAAARVDRTVGTA